MLKRQRREGGKRILFSQPKFNYGGGLILGPSQFTILSHLRLKMMLNFKVVKINSNIII